MSGTEYRPPAGYVCSLASLVRAANAVPHCFLDPVGLDAYRGAHWRLTGVPRSEETSPLPRASIGPSHIPTVGSRGSAGSYGRGTPSALPHCFLDTGGCEHLSGRATKT